MTTRSPRGWLQKFRDALRGVKRGVRGQSSFFVHFFAAALVVVSGAALHVTAVEWLALTFAIGLVLTAEMFNSALERLAQAITQKQHPHIRDALDIGSAAVLLASLTAAIIGLLVFGPRLWALLG